METIRPSNDKLKDRNVANIVSSSQYKKSDFLSTIEKAPRVIDSRLPGVNGVFQTKPKTKPSTATKFKSQRTPNKNRPLCGNAQPHYLKDEESHQR
jgi:hypothetical protein